MIVLLRRYAIDIIMMLVIYRFEGVNYFLCAFFSSAHLLAALAIESCIVIHAFKWIAAHHIDICQRIFLYLMEK